MGRIYQEPIFLMYYSPWSGISRKSELFLKICTSLVLSPDLIVVSIIHTIKGFALEVVLSRVCKGVVSTCSLRFRDKQPSLNPVFGLMHAQIPSPLM